MNLRLHHPKAFQPNPNKLWGVVARSNQFSDEKSAALLLELITASSTYNIDTIVISVLMHDNDFRSAKYMFTTKRFTGGATPNTTSKTPKEWDACL